MSKDGKMNDETTTARPDAGVLAVDRNYLAAQRTLMAWIRTSLSLISFGFTVGKFFEYLSKEEGKPIRGFIARVLGPDGVGMALVALGTLALVFAVVDHRNTIKTLQGVGLQKRRNPAFVVALLLCVFGIFAFLSLAL